MPRSDRPLWDVITKPEWELEFASLLVDTLFPPVSFSEDDAERVEFVLGELLARRIVAETAYPIEAFERIRDHIYQGFRVPWTTISRPMARFLFALGAIVRPRLSVVVGCGWGVSTGFLAGGLNAARDLCSETPAVLALDIQQENAEQAAANLKAMNYRSCAVEVLTEDGATALARSGEDIGVLLIDVDCGSDTGVDLIGKRGYGRVLQAALSRLPPGSLVLAHDVRWAGPAGEIDDYLACVRDALQFRRSVEIDLDIQGMEVSCR